MFISYVKDVEGSVHNINTFNGMHVRGVKGSFNCTVDSNTKYLNYMKLWFKAMNYNQIWNNTLN